MVRFKIRMGGLCFAILAGRIIHGWLEIERDVFFVFFFIIPREEDCPTDSCSHERAHYLIVTRVEKGKRPFSKHKKKRENGEEVGRKQGRMGRKEETEV